MWGGGVTRFCFVMVGEGSNLMLRSVAEEEGVLENGKIRVT